MKRTVSRPSGPAIAATTAQVTPLSGKSDKLAGENPPTPADNRITMAVLEQRTVERARGYDPYNAGASPGDVQAWKRRQKPR